MKKIIFIAIAYLLGKWVHAQGLFRSYDDSLLPYGYHFKSWEKPLIITKTYYVDAQKGSDNNPGTESKPFQTINKAAQIVRAGERVLIRAGVYRERITPKYGGESPEKMIIYEAYPQEKVIVKGSFEAEKNRWDTIKGWEFGEAKSAQSQVQILRYKFYGNEFNGYNPFGMMNIQHDRTWLDYKKVKMKAHFARRGMVFLNDVPLKQVEKSTDLLSEENGAFWTEHNGMIVYVRFPNGKTLKDFRVEFTNQEQVFAPEEYGLGYIKLKGIIFQHAGNGFPVPQRGMVSANRGHHWIIEDCTIEWANGTGIDLGNEQWNTVSQPILGHHIVRRNVIRNHGICGLAAYQAIQYLVEDNLFENIGWQDAEHGFEAAAIKFHYAEDLLFRRNIVRYIKHASGLWLDYLSNKNCRVTQNVFSDIVTARGAVYVEVSHNLCHIDHNIFHKTFSQYWISGDYGAGGNAFYTDGSDSIHFYRNFILDIENTGYGCYWNAERIIGGRGGITRNHRIYQNTFINCQKWAIELPNHYHWTDQNAFASPNSPFLKLKYPEPSMLMNLPGWQQLYGWETNTVNLKVNRAEINTERLTIWLDVQISQDILPFYSNRLEGISLDIRKKAAQ
ncbi:MAG: right-handed parallel beta-helix repeat-containing protein [Cytophagales bacterium]|nr:right-handed parallel beta-helix repeat-containing protein [Cytophagales bacterium]MDW8384309.1 right-handed parallel beta-helix repeat-containing protein [Flammeovirgaceae bacterium]